jgi:hypothetical protein
VLFQRPLKAAHIYRTTPTIIMMKKGGLFAAAALVVLVATSHSFSFVPQSQQRCPSALNAEQDNSQESNSVSNRRGFLSQVAATASASLLVSSLPQQAAASTEPTRIELSVDTEYMIRVLDYFDGDMRKVLGVLIRAPSTKVEIDAPSKTIFDPRAPKDAILSALSSFDDADFAAQQASWIKVEKPNRTIDFLLKKQFDLPVPGAGPGKAEEVEIVLKDGGSLKYKPMKLEANSVSVSSLEAAVGLAAVSYPLAWGLYNFESWQEEQEKKEKKAQMAAKKAAKAKAAAAKGTKKKGEKEAAAGAEKPKKVMKGQDTKKFDESQVDVNFKGNSAEWFLSETALSAKIEGAKTVQTEVEETKKEETNMEVTEEPPADAKGDASNGSEWFGRDVSESSVMALVEEAETIVMQERAQQGGYLDNLSSPTPSQQVVSKKQVLKKKSWPVQGGKSFGGYLDSLVQEKTVSAQQQGGYLENLSPSQAGRVKSPPKRQVVSKKQVVGKKSGSLGGYLDSL